MPTRPGRLAAGVDSSTQATKVVVVDPEREPPGIVATGRADHGRVTTETDPEVWWHALQDALDQTRCRDDIGAISVAAQQHGLVLLDADARPLRPALLWNDTRSAPQAGRVVAELGGPAACAAAVGSLVTASFTVSKWRWVQEHEPDIARRTRAIRLPHDYLTERLTGRPATDRGDASGTGWWSPHDGAYLPTLVEVDLVPPVLSPEALAGETAAGWLVAVGTGDNMAAALGLGLSPGAPVVSLGTSGTVFTVSSTPATDPDGIVAGFADATGRFLPLACTLNCTLAVDRVAAWLHLDRDDVAASNGVEVVPWFAGERTPNVPDATATITGLRADTDPRQILMATYEGVVRGLVGALDHLDRHGSGLDTGAPLTLIGGGARGRTWQEVVQRLSGRAVIRSAVDELVAFGAARQAMAVMSST